MSMGIFEIYTIKTYTCTAVYHVHVVVHFVKFILKENVFKKLDKMDLVRLMQKHGGKWHLRGHDMLVL